MSAISSLKYSTTVRSLASRAPKWLTRVSPALSRHLAIGLFRVTPRRKPPSTREQRVFAAARRHKIELDGRTLATWSWGKGPIVLLVHGWGGRGGQFHQMIQPLVRQGYRVVVFDAPGHGRSAGRTSDLGLMARAIEAVGRRFQIHAIVAHSLGAAAAGMALRDGLHIDKLVLVAAAVHPSRYPMHLLQRTFGFEGHQLDRTRLYFEARVGRRLEDISTFDNVVQFAPRHLLVIHDSDDNVTRLADAQELASAVDTAQLRVSSGLGHYRVLKAPETVQNISEFLGAAPPRLSPMARLEQELFNPELRWR